MAGDEGMTVADYHAALDRALRGNPVALARFGVTLRVPWWRRRLQTRFARRRFTLWAQREMLRSLDES